jgi:hypothetical protein
MSEHSFIAVITNEFSHEWPARPAGIMGTWHKTRIPSKGTMKITCMHMHARVFAEQKVNHAVV